MKNNNQKVIKKLSQRTMKQSRMRNFFAVAAICLTTLLFTAVFSVGFGMMQMIQEQTMREVGGKFHAGLKGVTMEQYEKISKDAEVASSSYNILLGQADNLKKRQAEIRMPGSLEEIEGAFVNLEEGTYPKQETDVVMDTITLKELKINPRIGATVHLEYTFMEKKSRTISLSAAGIREMKFPMQARCIFQKHTGIRSKEIIQKQIFRRIMRIPEIFRGW